MGFSKQEYWSGLPLPTPGDPPHPQIEPTSLASPALAGGFFSTRATWDITFQTPRASPPGPLFPLSPPAEREGSLLYQRTSPAKKVNYKALFILLASHHPCPDHLKLFPAKNLEEPETHATLHTWLRP